MKNLLHSEKASTLQLQLIYFICVLDLISVREKERNVVFNIDVQIDFLAQPLTSPWLP